MIRFTGQVHYKDGREESYEAGGAAQADWEEYAARHDYPLTPNPSELSKFPAKTWQMYLAYLALEVAEGFDVWRRTVLDVDSDDEPQAINPTLAEAIGER
jgi:hypothetical protein